VAEFACTYLDAKSADGFSSLRFLLDGGEVVEASAAASVLEIDGRSYACGDFNGMPVMRDDGAHAEHLGLNIEIFGKALREQAFPIEPVGAAHLSWPEERPTPFAGLAEPFGVLVLSRQTVQWEQGTYIESATDLHAWIVGAGGEATRVEEQDLGRLVRALVAATIQREPEKNDMIVEALRSAEERLVQELRLPNEAEREHRTAHVVTPLLAGVVASNALAF
jgi:hypothetical protein